MSLICIIPARGGSKRIPRKNIKDFYDKPIISYSIDAALKSNLFDIVMVSTDDSEIADIGKQLGAIVPFIRSNATSNDTATTTDVLIEVLDEYSKSGKHFDTLCCLYPCAPFVSAKKLNDAYSTLVNNKADCVFPLIKYSHPPQRAFVIKDGVAVMYESQFIYSRTQDLEPLYHDSGQFYFANTHLLKKHHSLLAGKVVPIVIDELDAVDIDNERDWERAELLYKVLTSKNRNYNGE